MQFCHYFPAKNGVLTRPEISIKTTNFQESGAADHEIYRRPVVNEFWLTDIDVAFRVPA